MMSKFLLLGLGAVLIELPAVFGFVSYYGYFVVVGEPDSLDIEAFTDIVPSDETGQHGPGSGFSLSPSQLAVVYPLREYHYLSYVLLVSGLAVLIHAFLASGSGFGCRAQEGWLKAVSESDEKLDQKG